MHFKELESVFGKSINKGFILFHFTTLIYSPSKKCKLLTFTLIKKYIYLFFVFDFIVWPQL